jgi:Flp pilus assembly protein TadD
VFSNFEMRLFRYAKSIQDQGGPMPIVTALALSMLLLAVTGCATSSDPSAAKQGTGKKDSTKKAIKHDQERSMNEESLEAVR